MLSTIHIEHGLPHLVDLDLGALLQAQERLEKDGLVAMADLLGVLATAGKAQCIRHLSAVVRATPDQLLEAEVSPEAKKSLLAEAARRPFAEAFRDAMDFFAEVGPSLGTSPASSETGSSEGTETLAHA